MSGELVKLTGCKSVIAILFLIGRSKFVLDFALTVHFLHLVVVSLYSHALPMNGFWWLVQICSAAFMTTLGVHSCRWRELRPISFGGSSTSGTNTGAAGSTVAEERSETDAELGYSMGRGRGRGRDGGGSYEMVGLSKDDSTT